MGVATVRRIVADVETRRAEMPLVGTLASVVIVSYNSRADLPRCLDSVLQTSRPLSESEIQTPNSKIEIIVVDNASTDGSAELVETQYPSVRLVKSAENRGFATANNMAVGLAEGEYIVALNPDTEVKAGWLQALLRPLQEARPGKQPVGMTTPRILMMDDRGRVNTCGNSAHLTGITVCRGLGRPAGAPELAQEHEVSAVSGACFAMRRDLWVRLGGFDETFFTYLEDTDLSMRARLAGYGVRYVPDATVYHSYKEGFSARKFYFLERNRLLMLLKLYRSRTLAAISPALLLAEAMSWGYAAKSGRGHLAAKLEAYKWLIANRAEVMRKRRATQEQRRVTDREMLRAVTWRLDMSQLAGPVVGKVARRALNPVFKLSHRFAYKVADKRPQDVRRKTRRTKDGDAIKFLPANLRVAHVTATFPPYHGGTGNVCYRNALELVRLGHEVHVFTAAHSDAPANESLEGIQVHRLRPLVRVGNAPVLPGLLTALRGFDVVHLHYPFFGGELTTLAARLQHTPLFVTYHQDVLLTGVRGIIERVMRRTVGRATLCLADRLLFTSADYGKHSHARPLLAGREGSIGELSNGVDTSLFTPGPKSAELLKRHGLMPKYKVALLVAGLDRAHYFKGVNVFLDALSRVSLDVKAIVIGDGDLLENYKVMADELGVADNVTFAGRVSAEELPEYYRLADVAVLPSVTMGEAFGLVLVEAMASGKAVIATNLPGVRTVVDNGENGLLVEPGDAEGLAGAMERILGNPREATLMGVRGRAKAEAHYDWRQIGRKLESMYLDVVAERVAR